jgi:hypothetical protein
MASVTVSPKFQVVIPRAVREKYGLKAGARPESVYKKIQVPAAYSPPCSYNCTGSKKTAPLNLLHPIIQHMPLRIRCRLPAAIAVHRNAKSSTLS